MKLTSYSTQQDNKQHTWTYPCLGLSKCNNNLIVLFESPGIGTTINGGVSQHYYVCAIGTRSTSWNMNLFEPFYGAVTITSHHEKTSCEGATGAVGHV